MKRRGRMVKTQIQTLLYRLTHRRWRRIHRWDKRRQGFTLTEIMVASLLLSVVMLIAWTGLMTALNMSQAAQAKVARKVELNMGLDMMTNEIRQAQAVNHSANLAPDGDQVSLAAVVADAGVDLNALGDYGDIALYLELPTDPNVAECPTNAAPVPAEKVDKIVYDVRQSPMGWLSPNAIVRYGRIPDFDGVINPCSAPVANDIVADAIAETEETPPCNGVLTGSNGFHVCQQGENVELLFQSSIDDLNQVPISSSVTPRQIDFTAAQVQPAPTASASLLLNILSPTPNLSTVSVPIEWSWQGDVSNEFLSQAQTYTVNVEAQFFTGNVTQSFTKSSTSATITFGPSIDLQSACFQVIGLSPTEETTQTERICRNLTNLGSPIM